MKQSGSTKLIIAALVAFLALPLAAWAQPKVGITITAEKEVVVVEKGKQVTKLVKTKDIQPDKKIVYTLSYSNTGDETATNVIISDPIPAGTVYIAGSATERGGVTFSIDHGKSFDKSTLLTYEVTTATGKKEKRIAAPEDYTDIQWIIATVPAGGKGSVSFRVKVK